MAELKEVIVPDIGSDDVEIIEICVAVGDTVEAEASILTVETDKATMDIPAPFDGVIKELKVKVGDKISQGDLIALMSNASQAAEEIATPAIVETPAATTGGAGQAIEVYVPNLDASDVDVIEVLVQVGDVIDEDSSIITVETDKASMDVPAAHAGTVQALHVKVGDKVSEGNLMLTILSSASDHAAPVKVEAPSAPSTPTAPAPTLSPQPAEPDHQTLHASPSVRRITREFGVEIKELSGTGRKGRITKEDVQKYVKLMISKAKATGGTGGMHVIDAPRVDFAKFGEIETVPLTRIQKISGPNLHRNWVTIPHVTQFDEADITELEAFRKEQNQMLAKRDLGFKITPLVFMMKAAAKTLLEFQVFNSSLSPDGESLIHKKYVHIGIAVDTPNGLVVPVVRDVDQKGIYELSKELLDISKKARDGKLTSSDMQGSCFTISSLGGIGGTAFTPIVNAPDVAILGVSKSDMKPKWNGSEFEPRLMLPLSLSYDHRVIDGALAAKFSVTLASYLSDIRKIIL
jgi:pyruvate dehydrogenase E2 component (dihydrolipoamide acetyltransferase)